MLIKDFIELISPTAFLELKSYYTDDCIKACYASDLTEEDMNLHIDSLHASVYLDSDHKTYLGMFIVRVFES